MTNIGFIRIQKECKEIILAKEVIFLKIYNIIHLLKLQENGITIEPLNENLSEIVGRIRGPPGMS
jgi:hypothetical protein